MKKAATDIRFISGFLIAHLLLFLTFADRTIFWYIFSATMLILISFAIVKEEIDDQVPFWQYVFIGFLSGILIFALFSIGNIVIKLLDLPVSSQVTALYNRYSPKELWHYLVLILIVVPGEEIFWRGFIQKRLLAYSDKWMSVPVSAVMYASVHLYANNWLLAFSALVAGLFWGWLYAWKRSIPLVIVSHLLFDLFLFVISPFR